VHRIEYPSCGWLGLLRRFGAHCRVRVGIRVEDFTTELFVFFRPVVLLLVAGFNSGGAKSHFLQEIATELPP
jgi:hypothetical protein